jgi:hypothetical protein
MERTQRLLGIAIAVLALGGCAAAERRERVPSPNPSALPTSSSSHGRSYHPGHHSSLHIWSHHVAAGGAAAAAAAAAKHGHSRTLGGRAGSRGGHFGGAGAHGGGG